MAVEERSEQELMMYVLSAKNGHFGKIELAVSGGSTVVISSVVNLHFLK